MLNVRVYVFTVLTIVLGSIHAAVLPDTRIVNGVDANIEDFPFLVSMRSRFTPTSTTYSATCGGTLIRPHIVLSAAHCFRNVQNNFHESEVWRWIAVAGTSWINSGGIRQTAANITLHPNYNMQTLDYDIGLVFLSSSFGLSSSIGVAEVPSADIQIPVGTIVSIAGWGLLKFDGTSTNRLQSAQVYIISFEECAANYTRLGYSLLPSMFCAGTSHLYEPIRDACQGDSGGPLMYGNVILGVVSWGHQCAAQYYPGVYASVPVVSRWIQNNIAGSNDGYSFVSNKLMVILISVITMSFGAL